MRTGSKIGTGSGNRAISDLNLAYVLQNSAIWSDEDGAGGDAGDDGVFSSSSSAAGSGVVRKPILVEVAAVPTSFPPSVSSQVVTVAGLSRLT